MFACSRVQHRARRTLRPNEYLVCRMAGCALYNTHGRVEKGTGGEDIHPYLTQYIIHLTLFNYHSPSPNVTVRCLEPIPVGITSDLDRKKTSGTKRITEQRTHEHIYQPTERTYGRTERWTGRKKEKKKRQTRKQKSEHGRRRHKQANKQTNKRIDRQLKQTDT